MKTLILTIYISALFFLKKVKNYFFILVFLFISTLSFAQKQFHITIQFVPKLDTNNIRIIMEVGKGVQHIPVVVKKGKIEIDCKVFSKYAYLSISSPATSNQKSYFITNEVSSIIFYGNDKSAKDYPFVNGKLINAIEIINSKEAKQLTLYVQKEQKDVDDFNQKFGAKVNSNDSLMSIYKHLGGLYDKKLMDFIKLNSNQYFSFWVFRMQIATSENINADSLLLFYQNVLYPKYKNLLEANFTLEYLKGRTIKINHLAPDFTTIDITGRKISLNQYRGKYVLLNFWATWCGPCVEELPLFNKLRNDYTQEQLEMISISCDRKMADLKNGIKKYSLYWTNVYQDQALINKYVISEAIPLTFLIDKDGKLVYMHVGALYNTEELRKILKKN